MLFFYPFLLTLFKFLIYTRLNTVYGILTFEIFTCLNVFVLSKNCHNFVRTDWHYLYMFLVQKTVFVHVHMFVKKNKFLHVHVQKLFFVHDTCIPLGLA